MCDICMSYTRLEHHYSLYRPGLLFGDCNHLLIQPKNIHPFQLLFSRTSGPSGCNCQDPASATPCCSTGNVGVPFRGGCSYSHFRCTHTRPILIRPAWSRCGILLRCGGILLRPSCHARRGLAAVSFFALIVSRPAWSRCGILLRCGGILLRPYRVTPGVVSLRYPSSLRRYPSSPLSCWGFLLVLVAAPGHGYREVGLWREIIDCVEKESPD